MEKNGRFFEGKTSARPMIYAYEDASYPGCLKVGYTAVDVEKRVAQQYPTLRPEGKKPYRVIFAEPALHEDGSSFTDHAIHRMLEKKGMERVGGEWFRCTEKEIRAAWLAVRTRTANMENRTRDFAMRPEQKEAVKRTLNYFKAERADGRTPRFLWNAKMRFGKTFAAYQLARRLNARRVLILTFKPAVQTAWKEDLETHLDFEGWQFICREQGPEALPIDAQYRQADAGRPIVCFGSFQDFLGVNKETGGIKPQHEWVREINWDLVIFDEYHFGAWKENAKALFLMEDEEEEYNTALPETNSGNVCDEQDLPITADHYLYLSGTPFRALNSGEFIEEQIYSWTYSDEQHAKAAWQGENNPYAALPRMVLLTYRMPEDIRQIALGGEFNEFDLNIFFQAKGKGSEARFTHEEYVQKWLDLIRGSHHATATDELKLGGKKPPMPYSDIRLMSLLNHTLWFLPDVASCHAMNNLLQQRQNIFYHDYQVIVCAGPEAGTGANALPPVLKAMGGNPLESKTITLSCGKLTTGITVKPWSGIFMLRNLSSPETYFQAAFRVQSPWTVDSDQPGKKEIVKPNCYVFDFALDRALKQIADYSCRLNANPGNPETKVKEFISFLPVLAYDGSAMKQVEASEILDMAMAGTSATLLARRWESALLVNVDNVTLQRLLASREAMDALMSIEGFRNLNSDLETIINKSDAVKGMRKEKDDLTPKEKKDLSQEEKEIKSLRRQIQQKLIKFAARIPIFMYLSDFREYCLKDVITQLEPHLFRKVTGLTEKDFELLVSLNVFNEALMNDAVYKFKRYEDASLVYTGINRHAEENVGLYATVLNRKDYEMMAGAQQDSMAGSIEEKALPTPTIDNSVACRLEEEGGAPPPAPNVRIHKGMLLTHREYGPGIVIKVDEAVGRMTVKFGKEKKLFPYPRILEQGKLIPAEKAIPKKEGD